MPNPHEVSGGLTANFVKNASGTWTGKVCEIGAVSNVTTQDLASCRHQLLDALNTWINSNYVSAPPSSGHNEQLFLRAQYGTP